MWRWPEIGCGRGAGWVGAPWPPLRGDQATSLHTASQSGAERDRPWTSLGGQIRGASSAWSSPQQWWVGPASAQCGCSVGRAGFLLQSALQAGGKGHRNNAPSLALVCGVQVCNELVNQLTSEPILHRECVLVAALLTAMACRQL